MNKWAIYAKTWAALFVATLTFINPSQAAANWDPEELFFDQDYSITQDPKFVQLKEDVSSYLGKGWCSQEKLNLLMDLIAIEQPQVCVEVGVFAGDSLLPVASALSFVGQGTVYAIDAWSNSEAVKYWSEKDPNKAWWSTVKMEDALLNFQTRLDYWKLQPYCEVVQQPSSLAVDLIPEIDFLHLDGDYSEQGSTLDVELYLPKVKSGGYILLSNLFTMVNNQQPKLKAFYALLESCEMVVEIERGHAILFRKN